MTPSPPTSCLEYCQILFSFWSKCFKNVDGKESMKIICGIILQSFEKKKTLLLDMLKVTLHCFFCP